MTTDTIERFLALSPAARRQLLRTSGAAQPAEAAGDGRIPALARDGWPAEFPASYGQEAQWFLWRLAPKSPAYHVPACYDVTGPLRVEALRIAVASLVARHEMLRTTFGDTDTGVVQHVHADLPVTVDVRPAQDREHAVALAAAAAVVPFDLRRGPLLRLHVWRYAPDRHLLLVVMHHIVVDERSSRIVERELGALYRSTIAGVSAELPPLPIQYADFAAWQRGADWQAGLGYWRDRLAGALATELPVDRPRPDSVTLAGATLEMEFGETERAALSQLCADLHVSRFVVLSAVFAVLLGRYSGSADVTFGTPVASRTDAAAAALVGFFLNTAALRVRLDGEASVADVVAGVRDAVAGASRHQTVPFQRVVEATDARPGAFRNPLFDVMFIYLSADQGVDPHWLGDDLAAVPQPIPFDTAHAYLAIAVVEEPGRAVMLFRYPVDCYDRATVEGWGDELRRLVVAAAGTPQSTTVAELIDGSIAHHPVAG